MKATASAVISVRGLCKDYDGVEILRDISFDVLQGATTCLLGPSGSGKPTLLRCINWLEVPGHGTIELGGQPMGRIGEADVARATGRRARPDRYRIPEFLALAAHDGAAERDGRTDPRACARRRRSA
ncbi:ATP-binding cassette domain-containing protein [Burkholderia gladioli]|uniref:ATP-binding cassette domain-containing protein n=1 Tax=Burkholderia gladioli TaxID=28095 RepID=UPI001FC803DE|nr:ATP-binding cassette domain-containing protein [Burkholderia gladioli]